MPSQYTLAKHPLFIDSQPVHMLDIIDLSIHIPISMGWYKKDLTFLH